MGTLFLSWKLINLNINVILKLVRKKINLIGSDIVRIGIVEDEKIQLDLLVKICNEYAVKNKINLNINTFNSCEELLFYLIAYFIHKSFIVIGLYFITLIIFEIVYNNILRTEERKNIQYQNKLLKQQMNH